MHPSEHNRKGKAARSARRLRALIKPWPKLFAEAIGWRHPHPARPSSGAVPTETEWEALRFAAFWFGHASVMLRLPSTDTAHPGVTLYADPNFRDHAGFTLMGRKVGRHRSTALPDELGNAPHPDVVLLSHAHFDHWDRDALHWLARISDRDTVAVIPTGTRKLLPSGFARVIEMTWDETHETHGLTIRAAEPRHWGARAVWDRHRGYNAYLIESAGTRVVFAGDTAETHAFDHLAQDGVDLAVLPIGNYYEPWENQHCTPEQAAAMAMRMNARLVLGMHHATFRDEIEPIDEPLDRLRAAFDTDRIICQHVGELWAETDNEPERRKPDRAALVSHQL